MTKMPDHEHGGPPEVVVQAAASRLAIQLVVAVSMVYAQIQGLGIVLGGGDRFSNAHSAYAIAQSFPGGHYSWGLILFFIGVIGLFAVTLYKRRTTMITLLLLASWSFAFALCFARAAAIYPTASTTGMWVYGKDAGIYMIIGAVVYGSHYYKERKHA